MIRQINSFVGILIAMSALAFASKVAVAESIEGTVNFKTQFHVQSFLRTTVAEVNAKVGDQVSEGEVLIQFDSTGQRAKVQIAENWVAKSQIELDVADAQFARQQELFDRGSLSLLLYEEAENALKIAQLNLSSAQARLDKARYLLSLTKVTSPMDALVIESNVNVGMVIHPELSQPDAPLMTLASAGQYVVEAIVPLETWQRLKDTLSVDVTVDGKKYSAKLAILSLTAAPRTVEPKYLVYFSFTEEDKLLLPLTPAIVSFD